MIMNDDDDDDDDDENIMTMKMILMMKMISIPFRSVVLSNYSYDQYIYIVISHYINIVSTTTTTAIYSYIYSII